MLKLPEGISGMKAETKPLKELRDLIIEDMEVPEEYYETTNYFYNYIDLNDDGKDEIFVMVTGPYTSGSGGSSALLLSENGGKLIAHLQLVPRSRICGSIHPLTHTPSWCSA